MVDSVKHLRSFWKNKRVFVTGHTGFKGTWLSIYLDLLGAKIFGYSLKAPKHSLFNQTNCSKLIEKNFYGNVNDLNNLKKKIIISKPDIVFHLAAQSLVSYSFQDPIGTFQTNSIGTANLLESVMTVNSTKAIVIITTDKVYKNNNKNISFKENDELGGKDPYSASKTCAEIIANSFKESFLKNKKSRINLATARSGNVLGGGDYSKNRLFPDILKSLNESKEMIVRNPNHIRPWQHVIEPIHGYILLAQKLYSNKLYNNDHAWNFGPKNNSFIRVYDLINKVKKFKKFKKISFKKNKIIETKILKLSSYKANKYLKWKQMWDINKTISKIFEWNDNLKMKKNMQDVCRKQIEEYLEK